jgi:ubiquinone/menaquinone biosynthesis C-methylase UbiE
MPPKLNNRDNFIAWNEEMAQKYDPEAYHLHPNLVIRWIERRRVSLIIGLLEAKEGDRILEVGCGAGNILEHVRQGQLFGIDLSRYLLNKAKKRLAGRKAGLSISLGEILPFTDDCFERLFCSEVLEHVPNPRTIVEEMVRVIKPGGVVVISVPNETMINRLKDFVSVFPFSRLLIGSKEGYQSPERMTDEWHLHDFNLTLLKQTVQGLIEIETIKGVPFQLFPLRFIIAGKKRNHSPSL